MKNIIVIESDSKIRRDLKHNLHGYDAETFAQFIEFTNKYCLVEEVETIEKQKKSTEEQDKEQEFLDAMAAANSDKKEETIDYNKIKQEHLDDKKKKIDLFIVDVAHIFKGPKYLWQDLNQWIEEMHQKTKAFNLWPEEERPPSVILIDYESEGKEIESCIHPFVEDLIFKPIDWELFKQKVGLIIDHRGGKGSFLYTHESVFDVRVGKFGAIEYISDFGFILKNPGPLKIGLMGIFYLPIQFDSLRTGVLAKCFKNMPHPDNPKLNHVCFTFYGIEKEFLSNMRKYLYKYQNQFDFWHVIEKDSLVSIKNAGGITANSKEKSDKTYDFLILELSSSHVANLSSVLTENFGQVRIHTCNSYTHFVQKLLSQDSVDKATLSLDLTTPAFSWTDKLTWKVKVNTSMLVDFNPKPNPKIKNSIFGLSCEEFFKDQLLWSQKIDPQDWPRVIELITYTLSGEKPSISVKFLLDETHYKMLRLSSEIDINASKSDPTIIIHVEDESVQHQLLQKSEKKGPKGFEELKKIDALFIAGEFVTSYSNWVEGFKEIIQQKGLLAPGQPLQCFLFVNESSIVDHFQWQNCGFDEVLFKPIDRNFVIKKIRLNFPEIPVKKEDASLQFYKSSFISYIAKDVSLEHVAEYGIRIKYDKALKPGTTFHLFHPLFVDERGSVMTIRCYESRDHSKYKGAFECYFVFLGVKDSFVKKIRKWIREEYAIKKSVS